MAMCHRLIFILAALLGAAACAKDPPRKPLNAHRLFLSIRSADDFSPEMFNPGKGGASVLDLAGALKACGKQELIVEDFGLAGGQVSAPSAGNNVAVVNCVRRQVAFGFDARRGTQGGGHGVPVGIADGS